MCGRYALALRPSDIRQIIEDAGMPVSDAPEDEGHDAPRQSYNFAPGYYGAVYRADTPDYGAGPAPGSAREDSQGHHDNARKTVYKLQSMKWGLVPFWTKRNPDYASMLKTINCRSDSLSTPGGIWTTMKSRKRCVVLAQGFFEWLTTGPKHKLPHYIKRADGQLMCFAGLWDCVQYDDAKQYTFTIITTDSNKQLRFLHDRMPVILEPGSDAMWRWLDPNTCEWSRDLQGLLQPFAGEVEVYPVSKDVGKVGNNSPSFVRPLYSRENKSNIANFFSSPKAGKDQNDAPGQSDKLPTRSTGAVKRKQPVAAEESPRKKQGVISSTHNTGKKAMPSKGTQKITKFFST